MGEKTYRLSTILKFIERAYENVLTDKRISEIETELDDDE